MNERENQLDQTLESGHLSVDLEIAALADQAIRIKEEMAAPTPSGARVRAVFVEGVASRSHSLLPFRFLAPAAVVIAGILALAGFGRTALPGQTLYPVRKALASVGLAPTPEEEVERRLADARQGLEGAAVVEIGDPSSARSLTLAAIGDLQRARALTRELERGDRLPYLATIGQLEDRATKIIAALERRAQSGDELGGDDSPGDNSGPGGDENSGKGSDSSGPGGGDDDNSGKGSDNSGPGGGGGDDSSGPGGGGEDSSGPGGGGGDNSGPGGGDDLEKDSSGPGSGDELDSSGSGSGESD